jgi:hypothetical protein
MLDHELTNKRLKVGDAFLQLRDAEVFGVGEDLSIRILQGPKSSPSFIWYRPRNLTRKTGPSSSTHAALTD